ncbi:MAG: TonB C-terminal domain-containing protein [Chlorobium sp.]|uniref:energy transducer TonB n=1 Tax=Chlorobium sp. TaxID=1095 RepID=UPI0025C6185F|nr:TonB C-terminal domain-containing protein [Chlorobium sp.]MCF8216945.1 TonB C-terminal domain-containing protein [Chlorobium sp.]MCF8271774.1 TonB C-terminal domain-containing protein [Chlorobium sp.]MCF8288162.1 TonB C-terminal domain-containing protein [Chlorobium sp.]MCF8291753.1 TonB C-terminal domain-containing protein [Chlorobium sp.]MCF8385845.1 TonB C-terminal domain-containing protein [Chlorobium sp.]
MKLREELTTEKKRFRLWLAVAAGVHIMFFLSVFAWQHFFVTQKPVLKIVSVSLVSLSGTGGSPMPASEEAVKGEYAGAISVPEPEDRKMPEKKQAETVKVPEQKTREAESQPEKPNRSVSVKHILKKPAIKLDLQQTSSRQERLNKALGKHRESVDATKSSSGIEKQDNLVSALARLKQKVASQGGSRGSGKGIPGGMGTARGGGGTADQYRAKLVDIIQNNWEFSSKMVQNNYGMEVYVHIIVLPDGTINEILYDKRSPSEYLNNSVKRALEKSSPLPGEYGPGGLSIGFVFTPEGIDG